MINTDNVYRYHTFIVDYKRYSEENPQCPKLETRKPLFRRSLYTIGLLLKHFNLKDETVRCGLPVSHSLHLVIDITFSNVSVYNPVPNSRMV